MSYTSYKKIGGKTFERVNGHKTKTEAQKYANMLRTRHPKWLVRTIKDDEKKYSLNNHWGTWVHMPRGSGTMYGG